MKRLSYILITSLLVSFLIGVLWKVPQWQAESQRNKINIEDLQKLEPKDRIQLEKDFAGIENNARTTLAQIIGGIVVLLGLYITFQNVRVAQKNVSVTEEGKITDRFSKAVELLGSEKVEIRLGGIYALERIARDSKKDHWTVMEVLTAFVRENAKPKIEPSEAEWLERQRLGIPEEKAKPREDIQAIMTVIGRRKWIDIENQGLNLRGANLSGCNLIEANLEKAILYKVNLQGALLGDANLREANFFMAFLNDASLVRANLRQAHLGSANLMGARLFDADLKGADLRFACIKGADLFGADLSNADLSYADLSDADFKKADLNKAYIKGANLSSAKLQTAHGLSLDQILSANWYELAILHPDLAEELKVWKSKQGE